MDDLFSLVPISFKDQFLGYGAQVLKSAAYGEDRIAFGVVEPQSAFVCVLDGHGGDAAAQMCAEELPGLMQKHQGNARKCFEDLDQRVSDKSGTCALVVQRKGQSLTVSSLGDCQAFLFEPQSAPVELSVLHSVEVLEEQQRMQCIGGKTRFLEKAQDWDPEDNVKGYSFWFSSNGKKVECVAPKKVRKKLGIIAHRSCAVSRSIGDHAFGPLLTCVPDTREFPLPEQCIVVMGSDGLFDQVSVDQIQGVLGPAVDWQASPQQIKSQLKPVMKQLCQLAFDGWGGITAARDDISLLVVYCEK